MRIGPVEILTFKLNKMDIDIQPKIEILPENKRYFLVDEDALYVFRLANGKDYSVRFTRSTLDQFLKGKKVSEQIKEWEDTFIRRREEAEKAIKTGKHPKFTKSEAVVIASKGMDGVIREFKTGKYKQVPVELNKDEINNFKKVVELMKENEGPITLIKLV